MKDNKFLVSNFSAEISNGSYIIIIKEGQVPFKQNSILMESVDVQLMVNPQELSEHTQFGKANR